MYPYGFGSSDSNGGGAAAMMNENTCCLKPHHLSCEEMKVAWSICSASVAAVLRQGSYVDIHSTVFLPKN